MREVVIGILAAIVVAMSARAGAATDELFLVPLPAKGWHLANQKRHAGGTIADYLPEGQTLEDWREMVTAQIFFGMRLGEPGKYLDTLERGFRDNCDEVVKRPASSGVANGFPMATGLLGCTRSRRSGKGEVMLVRVFQGRDRLYVATRAWRGEPFAAAQLPVPETVIAAWRDYLDKVIVCDRADPAKRCPDWARR